MPDRKFLALADLLDKMADKPELTAPPRRSG